MPKKINYYEFNKNPIKITDFLSNGINASAVSFEGIEKVMCQVEEPVQSKEINLFPTQFTHLVEACNSNITFFLFRN